WPIARPIKSGWVHSIIHATAAFVNPFTSDGAVEHPRKDLLRVVEQMPWLTYKQAQKELKNLINHSPLYLLY
ncbi:MAG: hypothetical protein ACRAU9_17895, partial [Shewanella xiamenensis]